ncbi:hypothetical protein ABB34_14640 [Stenotrophomonas daejeonensis]|uniref:Uncharacterized protein n=1 Tax=Stenotrophomonas daejeonensis TaxID=659018 RepID=A0A0R0DPR5_9GAMM|nr:hypothetical protein ABB34_14640 [Stenotrophomonas daejeonensis]
MLSLALWLSRALITARLTRSVQHEFDKKLEQLKSEFRAAEKTLEASLAQRSAELESLRTGALSGITQRRALLDKRRLEAIDQLWGTWIANQSARSLAMTMSVMKLENLAEQVTKDDRVREFIRVSGGGFDPSKLNYVTANLARPYVSDMAWALFSAMQAITGYYVAHWVALSHGIDSRKMVANEAVQKLILAVAPEYKDYLEANGLSASYHLLERFDTLLLAELKRMATDSQQDKESVEQAAQILEHARSLNEKVQPAAAG